MTIPFHHALLTPAYPGDSSPSLTSTHDRTLARACEAAGVTPPTEPNHVAQVFASFEELADAHAKAAPAKTADEFRQHALDALILSPVGRHQLEVSARTADEDVTALQARVGAAWATVRPVMVQSLADAKTAASDGTYVGNATARALLDKVELMAQCIPGIRAHNAHAVFLSTNLEGPEEWENLDDPEPQNPSEERDQVRQFVLMWEGGNPDSDRMQDRRRADPVGALLKLLGGEWPLLEMNVVTTADELTERAEKIRTATKRVILPSPYANLRTVTHTARVHVHVV